MMLRLFASLAFALALSVSAAADENEVRLPTRADLAQEILDQISTLPPSGAEADASVTASTNFEDDSNASAFPVDVGELSMALGKLETFDQDEELIPLRNLARDAMRDVTPSRSNAAALVAIARSLIPSGESAQIRDLLDAVWQVEINEPMTFENTRMIPIRRPYFDLAEAYRELGDPRTARAVLRQNIDHSQITGDVFQRQTQTLLAIELAGLGDRAAALDVAMGLAGSEKGAGGVFSNEYFVIEILSRMAEAMDDQIVEDIFLTGFEARESRGRLRLQLASQLRLWDRPAEAHDMLQRALLDYLSLPPTMEQADRLAGIGAESAWQGNCGLAGDVFSLAAVTLELAFTQISLDERTNEADLFESDEYTSRLLHLHGFRVNRAAALAWCGYPHESVSDIQSFWVEANRQVDVHGNYNVAALIQVYYGETGGLAANILAFIQGMPHETRQQFIIAVHDLIDIDDLFQGDGTALNYQQWQFALLWAEGARDSGHRRDYERVVRAAHAWRPMDGDGRLQLLCDLYILVGT